MKRKRICTIEGCQNGADWLAEQVGTSGPARFIFLEESHPRRLRVVCSKHKDELKRLEAAIRVVPIARGMVIYSSGRITVEDENGEPVLFNMPIRHAVERLAEWRDWPA